MDDQRFMVNITCKLCILLDDSLVPEPDVDNTKCTLDEQKMQMVLLVVDNNNLTNLIIVLELSYSFLCKLFKIVFLI